MSLSEETLTLQRAAHDLMYLGMDGSSLLHANDFYRFIFWWILIVYMICILKSET